MDKQKLTDEQREFIKKRLSHIEKNNLFDLYLIDDLKSLLSSEQAWREENKLLKQSKDDVEYNRNLLSQEKRQLQEQLNQAIEVLKWYADESNHEVVIYPMGKRFNADSEVSLDKGKSARDFLSSLSRGTGCSTCHGVGEITQVIGQRPEEYEERNIPCPDCQGTEEKP